MSKNVTVRRVKLTRQDEDLSVMQLEQNDEVYRVSFSEETAPEIVRFVETIMLQVKGNKQYEDKLLFWEDLLVALESEDITFSELPNHDGEVALSINVANGDKLVSYKDTITGQNVPNEIVRNIASVVSRVFSEYGIDTINQIENALMQEDTQGAYELLVEGQGKGLLHFGSKNTLTRLFHLIDHVLPVSLTSEERKKLFEIKFVLGEQTGLFTTLYADASQYIEEFGDLVEPKLIQQLLLLKANAASQQGKSELAFSLYQKVIKECTDDFATIAWAHRGLAMTLGYEDPDALYHESMAADAFLLSGNKLMFAQSKAVLAQYTKFSDPEKAIGLLEEAICVFDANDPLQKEKIAALSLNKAEIYNLCGQNEAALIEAERSITFRGGSGQFGNESKTIASLHAAILFEQALEVDETKCPLKDKYEGKIKELENIMLDEDKVSYSLLKRLSNALLEKNLVELEQMKEEVLNQDSSEIIVSFWVAVIIAKTDASLDNKLELLEEAWAEAIKPKVRNDLRANVCSLFAEIYKDNGSDEKALEWYKKALDLNPFIWTNRQNYVALLWKNNKWKEAVAFFEEQRGRFGDLTSIMFGYGKSLVEAGEPGKALPILRIAQKKNPDAVYINEYLSKALDNLNGDFQTIPTVPNISISAEVVTLASVEQCLADFIQFIQKDKRMTFWKFDLIQKKHNWVPSPEQHGQNLLHTFVKARFGNNVEALEEVGTGAGRIDIYLRFKNGLRTIIELKMCGGGRYSEGYAIEGIQQLTHYLENKETHLGYLVIFDGRRRDCGKGIEPQYLYEKFTIRSYVADVRPQVK